MLPGITHNLITVSGGKGTITGVIQQLQNTFNLVDVANYNNQPENKVNEYHI